MKIALVLVLVLEAVASASPLVTPPAGWKGGPNDDLLHSTGNTPHFGGVHGIIEAERYDAPKPGVVLYATRVAANTTATATAAQAELATVEPSNVEKPKVKMSTADKAIVASLEWKDDKAGIKGATKMMIAATKDKVIAVKGECMAAADADLTDCTKALATLDTGIDPKDREDLTSTDALAPMASSPLRLPDEPLKAPKTVPMIIPPAANESPRTDTRPIVIGGALIALAAFFYWNRKRAQRNAA